MTKKKIGIILLVCLILFGGIWKLGPLLNFYLIPPSAKEYGKIALNYMDQGIYANSDEWKKMKVMAKKALENVETYEDTYKILNDAAKVAGGKHSSLVTPSVLAKESDASKAELDGSTLIITLPSCNEISADNSYAKTIWEALQSETYENIVIDLRNNLGGNMLPMLSAISPLLEDGSVITVGNEEIVLEDGVLKDGSYTYPAADFKINCPVAVLQNELTASSGEITLLALMSNHYKTFGSDSAGYTSCNQTYYLYDGAALNITVAGLTTKDGTTFEDVAILPDNYCEDALVCALDYLN